MFVVCYLPFKQVSDRERFILFPDPFRAGFSLEINLKKERQQKNFFWRKPKLRAHYTAKYQIRKTALAPLAVSREPIRKKNHHPYAQRHDRAD